MVNAWRYRFDDFFSTGFYPEMWEIIQNEFEIEKVFPGSLSGGDINVCMRRDIK